MSIDCCIWAGSSSMIVFWVLMRNLASDGWCIRFISTIYSKSFCLCIRPDLYAIISAKFLGLLSLSNLSSNTELNWMGLPLLSVEICFYFGDAIFTAFEFLIFDEDEETGETIFLRDKGFLPSINEMLWWLSFCLVDDFVVLGRAPSPVLPCAFDFDLGLVDYLLACNFLAEILLLIWCSEVSVAPYL